MVQAPVTNSADALKVICVGSRFQTRESSDRNHGVSAAAAAVSVLSQIPGEAAQARTVAQVFRAVKDVDATAADDTVRKCVDQFPQKREVRCDVHTSFIERAVRGHALPSRYSGGLHIRRPMPGVKLCREMFETGSRLQEKSSTEHWIETECWMRRSFK